MPSAYKGTRDVKKEHYALGPLLTEQKKIEILQEHFVRRVGYPLNIRAPKTFNEKVMWSKLYYQDPLITVCCDKFAVKAHLAAEIGPEYTVPTIASWERAEDIDFDALPQQFVLKVNWSSGYNIIVRDKAQLDRADAVRRLKRWTAPDRSAYYQFFNWGYKHVKPVIYAETYLEQIDGQVYDYKFFCFGGKAQVVLVVTNRNTDEKQTFDYFDMDFRLLPFVRGGVAHAEPPPRRPLHFERMTALAQQLAEPFPFCRVDFYEAGGRIYVGEMTFYPGGGLLPFDPPEWDEKLGQLYRLPEKRIIDEDDLSCQERPAP